MAITYHCGENILVDRDKAIKEVEEIIRAYKKEMGFTFRLGCAWRVYLS